MDGEHDTRDTMALEGTRKNTKDDDRNRCTSERHGDRKPKLSCSLRCKMAELPQQPVHRSDENQSKRTDGYPAQCRKNQDVPILTESKGVPHSAEKVVN